MDRKITTGVCDVCYWAEGKSPVREIKYCSMCDAYLCDEHRSDFAKRSIAFAKRALRVVPGKSESGNLASPGRITSLSDNQIFVFGSNEAGIHGAGAAKMARERFGAVLGVGSGRQGQSYGIPTKDRELKPLPVPVISGYVDVFTDYARSNEGLVFLVTEVGCGYAGNTPEDMAPLFVRSAALPNVKLPLRFIRVIKNMK